MSAYLGLPLLGLIAILQSTLFARLQAFGGTPDLMLLTVVSWSLIAPGVQALVWAFAGGVLLDLLSGGPLGASALGLLLVAYLAGFTQGQLWGGRYLLPLAAALFGTLVYHLVALGFLAAFGRPVEPGLALNTITFPAVFVNLVLVLPVYAMTQLFHDFLTPPELEL